MLTFHITLRRGETHVEHYGVQERELQWRSRRSKRDIPNVFHVALNSIHLRPDCVLASYRSPLRCRYAFCRSYLRCSHAWRSYRRNPKFTTLQLRFLIENEVRFMQSFNKLWSYQMKLCKKK